MNQAALFGRFQRRGYLQGDVDRCENVEGSQTANAFFQRFALDQLHRVKELADFLANAELIHSRDVRVAQSSGRARFAHEALPRFRTARRIIGVDDLQRDRAIERFIDRAIGDSHRAATQLPITSISMKLDRVRP